MVRYDHLAYPLAIDRGIGTFAEEGDYGAYIRSLILQVVMTAQGDRVGAYLHGTRIGVLVDLTGGSDALARDVAMHVAASKPVCVGESDVPAELLAKEREIITAQSQQEGKPANIIDKVVEGQIRKFFAEVTLLEQPWVRDESKTIQQLVDDASKAAGAPLTVKRFVRYRMGE